MSKIKLTKGELKRYRDAMRQYERYLPTLQLKKQQLQIEIIRQTTLLDERRAAAEEKASAIEVWAGLLGEPGLDFQKGLTISRIATSKKGVAGIFISVFESVEFKRYEYDFFETPLWVDKALEELRGMISLMKEIDIIERGIRFLREELRIATQRVNLFEKVKIPEAEEAIRHIKIYIGDQMANAVGRSKIAKRKIEALVAT
jgi:V/A-type H+-transporting ATPase subunit D